MLSNRLAFAALAVACIGAAAGGGYLATRQNTVPAPMSAQSQPAAVAPNAAPAISAQAATATPAKPVQETEGIVGDVPARSAAKTNSNSAKTAEAQPRAAAIAPRASHPAPAVVAHQEPVATLPSVATPQPPIPAMPAPVESVPAAPRAEERAPQEPVRAPEPPAHTFEELVVASDSVIGFQTETRISSETARVEDRVEGRVTRDVRVGGRVAIPAGTKILGSVMQVERGGKVKEKAHLGIRFHTLVLADGTRLPISTEMISRDGESPKASSSQKIGGAAVGGAILGAILGGGKGMAIGAAAGAGAGGAAVAAGDRKEATLPAGTSMTVRILQPITVTTDNKN
jgi:hypothetical protein